MLRLGVFGGTFDPVHFGHLRPAVELRAALALDEIRLVPARLSPLRGEAVVSGAHRLAMLQASVAGEPDLTVDDRELHRAGPSYTIDTLEALAAERPQARLYLIVGGDVFASFDRWHRWREILQRAHLVVAHRPGAEPTAPEPLRDALAASPRELEASAAGRVWIQPVTQLDISATAIRALAAERGDLRYLMPAAARRYLEDHRLYDA